MSDNKIRGTIQKYDRSIIFLITIIFSSGMAYQLLKTSVSTSRQKVAKIESVVESNCKVIYNHALFIARQDEVNKNLNSWIDEMRRHR